MRLIQFTASKVWRGHEQKIIYLYEAFEKYNYVEEQWIICPRDSKVYQAAKEKGFNVITLNISSEYSLKTARTLRNLTKEKNASLIFLHNSKAHTVAVISKLLFNLGVPLVLCRTLIKRVDTNFLRKWKYNYKGIEKIICVSHPVVNVLKYAVNDESKLCVVGSVTDIEKFPKQKPAGVLHQEFDIPKDYKIIGNIAEFTGFKDHYTWVDTVKILVDKFQLKAKFLLVGKGKLEEDIRKYVNEKQLQNHIIFTGFRKDIPLILPEFDLFLFTSNNEPTGGVLLESYACKVPIVAADAGGIPEVVKHEKTGLLAKVETPEDFAKKVMLLIDNDKLRKKYTENGLRFLKENFTKAVIAKKMYQELKEVEEKYRQK